MANQSLQDEMRENAVDQRMKENKRAIRFYYNCGFHPDGQEMFSKNVEAPEIRMVRDK